MSYGYGGFKREICCTDSRSADMDSRPTTWAPRRLRSGPGGGVDFGGPMLGRYIQKDIIVG